MEQMTVAYNCGRRWTAWKCCFLFDADSYFVWVLVHYDACVVVQAHFVLYCTQCSIDLLQVALTKASHILVNICGNLYVNISSRVTNCRGFEWLNTHSLCNINCLLLKVSYQPTDRNWWGGATKIAANCRNVKYCWHRIELSQSSLWKKSWLWGNASFYWSHLLKTGASDIFECLWGFMSFWCTELCTEETLHQMCWGFKDVVKTPVFVYQR